jgi:hypothetical protein
MGRLFGSLSLVPVSLPHEQFQRSGRPGEREKVPNRRAGHLHPPWGLGRFGGFVAPLGYLNEGKDRRRCGCSRPNRGQSQARGREMMSKRRTNAGANVQSDGGDETASGNERGRQCLPRQLGWSEGSVEKERSRHARPGRATAQVQPHALQAAVVAGR